MANVSLNVNNLVKVTVLGVIGFFVARQVTGMLGLTSIQRQIPS